MILQIENEFGMLEPHVVPEFSRRVISAYVLYVEPYKHAYVDLLFDDGSMATYQPSTAHLFHSGMKIEKGGFLKLPALRKQTDLIKVPTCEEYTFGG